MAEAWRRSQVAGHFGELMQGRLGPNGPVTLVTLPCPTHLATVRWHPHGSFHVHSPQRLLNRRTFASVFQALGQIPRGRVIANCTMPAGGGAGASTATILALINVLAGKELTPDEVAQVCVAIEGACDPLMHETPDQYLWASRHGVRLGELPPVPSFDFIGGFDGDGIRTDAMDTNFADIADLIPKWIAACGANDLRAAGDVAQASADRNAALRGGPSIGALKHLAQQMHAVAVVVAHTGSARGLMFPPGAIPRSAPAALRSIGLRQICQFRSRRIAR